MAIPCAVLMCHAPIVIPAIAGPRAAQCSATTAAMRQAAQRLASHEPDVLVIISPHTPRRGARWGIVRDPVLEGDFSRFGVPEVAVSLAGAPRAARALDDAAQAARLRTWTPSGRALDHGALVPLYFVHEAGLRAATLLIALPYPGTGTEAAMGRAIAAAARALGQRWAVLASGDMSHRLTRDAPAGFHPSAREFDQAYVEAVAAGELERAAELDPALRELAAEDVVDSVCVASGAVDFDARGHTLLSYEGPFGVGYMEAVLHDANAEDTRGADESSPRGEPPPAELLTIAREAIAARLTGRPFQPVPLPPPWQHSRGVFVTLRTAERELRGCIGHLEPVADNLSHEVASCAISAAVNDPRFPPVLPHELAELRLELSLLSTPEPTALEGLDPARYGVVVSGRGRRGVLLPDVDGVESAADQVSIAARKAGLGLDDVERLERFAVLKLRERAGARGG